MEEARDDVVGMLTPIDEAGTEVAEEPEVDGSTWFATQVRHGVRRASLRVQHTCLAVNEPSVGRPVADWLAVSVKPSMVATLNAAPPRYEDGGADAVAAAGAAADDEVAIALVSTERELSPDEAAVSAKEGVYDVGFMTVMWGLLVKNSVCLQVGFLGA